MCGSRLNSSTSNTRLSQYDQTISLRAAFWGECFRLPVEPGLKLMGSAAVSDTSAACSNLFLDEASLDTFTLGALQQTLLFRTTHCFAAQTSSTPQHFAQQVSSCRMITWKTRRHTPPCQELQGTCHQTAVLKCCHQETSSRQAGPKLSLCDQEPAVHFTAMMTS